LQRGYALVRSEGELVKSIAQLEVGQTMEITLSDGVVTATITDKEQTDEEE
jgi:exodeoxyribonuclease VII large subunit